MIFPISSAEHARQRDIQFENRLPPWLISGYSKFWKTVLVTSCARFSGMPRFCPCLQWLRICLERTNIASSYLLLPIHLIFLLRAKVCARVREFAEYLPGHVLVVGNLSCTRVEGFFNLSHELATPVLDISIAQKWTVVTVVVRSVCRVVVHFPRWIFLAQSRGGVHANFSLKHV